MSDMTVLICCYINILAVIFVTGMAHAISLTVVLL